MSDLGRWYRRLVRMRGVGDLYHITPAENTEAILADGFFDGDCPYVAVNDGGEVLVLPCTGVWLSDRPLSDVLGPGRLRRRKWSGPQALFVLRVPDAKQLEEFAYPKVDVFREWCVPAEIVNGLAIVDVRYVPAEPEEEEQEDFPLGFLTLVLARSNAADSSVHGLDHWRRVAANGRDLAAETPGADPYLVQLFALFHDSMRWSDGVDAEHGLRAGNLVREVFSNVLPRRELELLVFACEAHAGGSISDEPTVGVCWDSDRLELPRVGVQPDPRLLSTVAARSRASLRDLEVQALGN